MKKLISRILCSGATFVLSMNALAIEKYQPDGYHVETIMTPPDVRFEIAGLDSDPKTGDIYVATRLGDIWTLANGRWSKFADGLHEPTGLLFDDDGTIVVTQKPEMTRIIDTNNDGVADEYIHLASGWEFHDNYHEFNFGPVKDINGDYHGTLNLGHNVPDALSYGVMDSGGGYRGWAYKVTTKGKFKPYSSGLRSPAGIGLSPNGDIFYTDNQGDWVETSKLHLLEPKKFYGHPVSLRDHPDFTPEKVKATSEAEFEAMRELPVAWIPHNEVANSPGNPVWDITEGKFGPFENQIFIGDQTKSNIFRVMLEKVKGKYQGAVINFIGGLQSGNIRVEFDKDGALWVGQTARGWWAQGGKPFGLEKVTWDGTNPFELLDINLTKKGFVLTFTEALDASSVSIENILAQEWNYTFSHLYGSEKKSLTDLKPSKVKIDKKGKAIHVTMPLTAEKVVMLNFDGIKSKTGRSPSVTKVYYTLNKLK